MTAKLQAYRRVVKAKRFDPTEAPDHLKMENYLEYHSHICMRWKVKRTDLNKVCQSHPVNHFGQNIALQLINNTVTGLKVFIALYYVRNHGSPHNIETYLVDKNGARRFVQKFPFTYVPDISCAQRDVQNLSLSEEIPSNPVIGLKIRKEIWSIDSTDFRANVETLFTNDELNIECVVSVDAECYSEATKNDPAPRDACLEKLSLDIYQLYRNGEVSDATLKCGDKTIPVHKIILSARSDVFAAMFRSQMAETRNGEVEISDIQVPILDHLIRYIYSGMLDKITDETLVELYEAADKYGIEILKWKCACLLSEELTVDNVCFILSLAEMHSDQSLKRGVISFILQNKKFLTSLDWIDFSKKNPELAVEVCNSVFKELNLK